MTLTEQQKQVLRAQTASAKVQSKLPPQTVDELWDAEEEARDREKFLPLPNSPVENFPSDVLDQVVSHETTVDDIPWDGTQALAVSTIEVPVFVEGFRTHGLTVEQIEDAAENLQTYLNVKVRHVSEFIGRELKVIGSANVPLEGNVTDRNTGVVQWMKWVQPRWKLAAKDEMTGQHVVLHGGGSEALRLVRLFTALYGPGDWKQPKKVTFTMETRDNGHILYHISHWRIRDVE